MLRKYQQTIKIFSLVLAISLLTVLISCSSNDNIPNNNPINESMGNDDSATTSDTLETTYVYPEYDFEGAVINVLARRDGYGGQDFEDIYTEVITGEVLNDAVYNRTSTVEAKYNVTVAMTYNNDVVNMAKRNIQADDDAHQIIQEKLMYIYQTLAVQNYLYNLKDVDTITLEAPWYNQNVARDLTINNKIFVLGGDMTVSDKSGVMLMIYNKKIHLEYGLENMYQLVDKGNWTLDKLSELMKQTSLDLNGDGKMTTEEDQWGLNIEPFGGWNFSVSSGYRIAELDENGLPYLGLNRPEYISKLDKILDIMYDSDNLAPYRGTIESFTNTFMENRNFLLGNVISTLPYLRHMDDDFGLIPFPKYDESQVEYISPMSPWVSRFIAIPCTCDNVEMVGAVIDAMSRESTETVVPGYYENLLYNKIARDEESIEMLKLVFSTVAYDIGSIFNWNNIWEAQSLFVQSKSRNYVSYIESREPAVQALIDATIEEILQYD